jgi:hypothetical protein
MFMVKNYHLSFINKTKIMIARDRSDGIDNSETMEKIETCRGFLIHQLTSINKNIKTNKVDAADLFVNNRDIVMWNIQNHNEVSAWCREDSRTIKRQMQYRLRQQKRIMISSFVKKCEKNREDGKVKKVIDYVLNRWRAPIDEVVLEDGTIITDKMQVHDEFTKEFEQWHDSNRANPRIDWQRAITEDGYLLQAAADTDSPVPLDLIKIIQDSMLLHKDNDALHREMAKAFQQEFTFDEFLSIVKNKPSGKSAGISGFTINMLKAMPIAYQENLFDVLNELYKKRDEKELPYMWLQRWICTVPKNKE